MGSDPSQGGQLSTRGMPITAGVHPDYRELNMVPEWAVPQTTSVALSLLALVAGAVLGLAFADVAAGSSNQKVIGLVAKECSVDPGVCSELMLRGSPRWLWVVLGVLLCAVYVIAQLRWSFGSKGKAVDMTKGLAMQGSPASGASPVSNADA